MNTRQLIKTSIAALFLAASAAQAAPQATSELPRVVITGKSSAAAKQPVQQLPRVVVSGLSVQTQMQQLMLAAAKPEARGARRNG